MRIAIIFISLLVSIQSFGQTQSTLPSGSKQHPSYRSPDGRLWIGIPGKFFPFYTSAKVDSIINSLPVKNLTAGDNIIINKTNPNNWIISSTGGGSGTSNWGDIAGTLSNQTDLWSELSSRVLVGGNISLLNNNAGYIVSGTGSSQVRNNSDLDSRYLQSESDPTVPNHVKNISSGDISNWNSKISSVTGGVGITVDATDPYSPVISASIPDSSVTLPKLQNITRGTVLGLASGGTNTWTLLTPSHGTYVGEWRPNLYAGTGFLLSYENKLYKVLTNADPVPPPTNPSQYQLIHSAFRRFTYGVTYTPAMLVVMGPATSNYYTTSANIKDIAPTDVPINTPSPPQELTVGDGLIVTPGGVLRTTGAEAITGLIQAGSNITMAGNGTPNSPYIIAATGGGGGGGSSTLSGLTDVSTTGATNGQVLTYNSGTWFPTTVSGGGSFRLRSGSNAYLSNDVTLLAGANVTLSQSGQSITINATGGGGGGSGGISALTGDVLASGSGSVPATIANGAVTLAKMANLPANTFIGRLSSAGVPQALTANQAARILNTTGTNSTNTINMSGPRFIKLSAINSNTTYVLNNNFDGANVQATVTNSNNVESVSVNISGAVGLGSLIIPPGKVAVISIQDFGGGTIRYTVISEI